MPRIPVEFLQVGFTEEEQQPPAGGAPGVTTPRLGVTAEALEQLGIVVLSANNQQDLEAALKIIEYIQKLGANAEIQIRMVSLQHVDATSLSNQLGFFLQRVNIGPLATTLLPARTSNITRLPPIVALMS